MKTLSPLVVLTLAILASNQANAATLFSDLGTGSSEFSNAPASVVKGSGFAGPTITQARPFTVAGTGLFDVTQIDLGLFQQVGSGNFTASIWTSVGGVPGSSLGSWNLNTTTPLGATSGLTTQTGITGVTLTGGTTYFMVVGAPAFNEGEWADNNQGAFAAQLGSLDGGGTWIHDSTGTQTAFDVIGDPASSVPLPAALPAGLLLFGVVALRRRLSRQGEHMTKSSQFVLMMILCIAAAWRQPLSATTLDQSYGTLPPSFVGGPLADGGIDIAQTFTVGLDGQLTSVDVAIGRTADATGPLLVDIRSTTGGVPDPLNTSILASASVAPASVPVVAPSTAGPYDASAFAFVSVDLTSSNLFVTPGEVLAITLRSETAVGSFGWNDAHGDPYPGGHGFFRANNPGTSAFNIGGGDQFFQTFVTAVPLPSAVWAGSGLLGLVGGMHFLRRRLA